LTDDELVQRKKVDKKKNQLSLIKVSAPNSLDVNDQIITSQFLKTYSHDEHKKIKSAHGHEIFFPMPVLAF